MESKLESECGFNNEGNLFAQLNFATSKMLLLKIVKNFGIFSFVAQTVSAHKMQGGFSRKAE